MPRPLRLGELLLQAGAITRDQLDAGLAMQMRAGGRLGSNLIEMGVVDERTLARVLAEQLKIPSATASQLERPVKGVLALVAKEIAVRHRAIPLRLDGNRLWVALADPTDREALAALERASGHEVRPMVAPDVLIDFALGKHYGVQRRARVVQVRDAELLEASGLAVYEPHVAPAAPPAATSALGFLDERQPGIPPMVPPRAAPPPPTPPVSRPPPRPMPAAPPPIPAPSAARAVDADGLRARLLTTTSDGEIFERLLDALEPMVGRLGLLLVRGGVLVGHRGRGIEPRSLELIRLPVADAPALVKLIEAGGPYLGPLPSQFAALFEESDAAIGLCLPITLGKRAIGVVICGRIDPVLATSLPALERVCAMVDLALHASHLRARLSRA